MPKVSEYPEDIDPSGSDVIAVSGVATSKVTIDNLAASEPFSSLYTAAGNYQPLDSDLTAIAALSTSGFGRALLALVDAAALRSAAGLDADLGTFTVPASTTISTFGASLVDDADAATARATLELGTAATSAASAFQPADSDLTTIAAANNGAVLAATTASFTTADETKLDGIEAGATADQTAAEILTAVKTVDGSGSGLDADLVRGVTPTAAGLALLDDVDAAAQRTTLGVDYTTLDERARDTIGSALVAGSGVTITPNDGADTITIASTAPGSTNLSYDASTITVQSDTGTDATLTLADTVSPGLMSATDKLKLDGLTAGAPVMYNYNGVAFPTRISICPLTTPVWFVNRIDATQPTDFVEGLDVLTAVRAP
jgi:hypothetical protein